jgi:hypothetical protein
MVIVVQGNPIERGKADSILYLLDVDMGYPESENDGSSVH